jgi:hypothetical protein
MKQQLTASQIYNIKIAQQQVWLANHTPSSSILQKVLPQMLKCV